MARYYSNASQAQRFQPGTTVRADEVDAKFDSVASGFSDVEGEVDRSLKLVADGSDHEVAATATQRRNKVVGFDGTGAMALLDGFSWRGDYASGTEYFVNDVFRDPATKNLHVVEERHAAGATIDANKTDLAINVADLEAAKVAAQTAQSNAEDAQGYAEQWANRPEDSLITGAAGGDGVDDFSALHHANKAAGSASAASSSASSASSSASAAQSSATAASNSAAASAQSASLAATRLDTFDDAFLGAKSTDPSTDNDGDALATGALYFNSATGALRVYTGSAWIDAINAAQGLTKSNNLADLQSPATARTNLGLGTAATTDASVYVVAANNLADVQSAATARTNLGLGTAATTNSSTYLAATNNLGDVQSIVTARNNLGLGTAATTDASTYLAATNNLADLQSTATARENLGTPLIPQPINQSPADTTSGTIITPTLQALDYYSLYGVPMAAAQWQISTVSDFATTEVDDEVAGTATSYTPASNLSTLTTYYWRVRYKDDNGEYSAWSEATSFATADIYVDTPSITSPADNATDIPEQPVIESSAFAAVNGSDTHSASQWRVTRVSDGTIVHESGDETSNLESYTIPAGVLDEGAVDYTVEVRHKGSTYGYSAWSPVVTFTTASAFFDPAVDPIGTAAEGGYYAGDIVSDVDGQTYALIVSDGSGDSVQTGAGTFQWRTSQTALSQAQTLSDGRSVMDHILANETLSDFPAFEWIQNNLNSGSGLNGYTDWYLPARNELELIYRHFKPKTQDNNDGTRATSGFGGDGATRGTNNSSDPTGSGYTASNPSQTSIASFQQGNSDALEDNDYWSSTERDASYSWRQYFYSGGQYINVKDEPNRVRAVRRIAL